jgi:hypothetical protein
LQDTWRALADHGSAGRVTIRGRREGEREERELDRDALRNCRWLAWKSTPRRPDFALNPSGVGPASGPYEVAVRRHEDTFEGEFEGLKVGAINYVELVVSRHELMDLHPQSKISSRKLKSSLAAVEQAQQWLEEQLATLPSRSRTRNFFLEQMQIDFGLPSKRAKEAWAQVTRKHTDWARPGRPRKNPPSEKQT